MRFVFTYLILSSFLLQLGSRVYILASYQLNKEYIAENLCEKKDEPESCCEGKCHMAKELDKVEKAEDQGPINSKEAKKEKAEETVLYCTSLLKLSDHSLNNILLLSDNPLKVTRGYRSETFHPPGKLTA